MSREDHKPPSMAVFHFTQAAIEENRFHMEEYAGPDVHMITRCRDEDCTRSHYSLVSIRREQ